MILCRFACLLLLLLFGFLGQAKAATYPVTGSVIGEITHYKVTADDNLYSIARRFDLGIVELMTANPGIDPWLPPDGTELVLPTMHVLPDVPRQGIVINLPELRLYFFPTPHEVMTFPLGIGREGWQTPVGTTKIMRKRKDPVWIPPPSIRKANPDLPAIFPPGPDNPLGEYALDLGWPDYRIHGTNRPYGIGFRSSHGCMRLYPEDIAELFPLVEVGTPVTVIDKTYKLDWQDNRLWLEITPTQQAADQIIEDQKPETFDIPQLYAAVSSEAGKAAIDWYAVDGALDRPSGIPVVIARRTAPEQ